MNSVYFVNFFNFMADKSKMIKSREEEDADGGDDEQEEPPTATC